jgi:hypothetical protein
LRQNIFNRDFQEFILALNLNQVAYILVGGYAVIIHGYSRTTGDMDIWVNPTEKNYYKLMNAFFDFGLPTHAISLDEFMDPTQVDVFTFGRPPVCLDIMTSVKGLSFQDAWNNSITFPLDNELEVKTLCHEDLIVTKQASGRHRDLDDIENLS